MKILRNLNRNIKYWGGDYEKHLSRAVFFHLTDPKAVSYIVGIHYISTMLMFVTMTVAQ